MGIFGDLFHKYDEISDEEYEKITKEFEKKEQDDSDENIIQNEQDAQEEQDEQNNENSIPINTEDIQYNLDNDNSSNIETLCDDAKGLDIVTKARNTSINNVLSNSFGFGGTNASLVLSKY